MKIVLTGSLGHIGKNLAPQLVAKGHSVTVISSNAEKYKDIEAIGAKAAIGNILDIAFLNRTFQGADAVFLMEPPQDFFNKNVDNQAEWIAIAKNYKEAVLSAGITKVIHLSSIGAHTDKGVGMLAAHYFVEQILRQLPEDVYVKFMRPVGFYYNMFSFIGAIKNTGAIFANYPADENEPWVSPSDIADTIAEEMDLPFVGKTVRYIASDEFTPNDIVKVLGAAIGKPDLKWIVVPDEKREESLINIGMSPQGAKGLMEMDAGRRNGKLYEDYMQHRPRLGKVKLADFAKEFAIVYNK